MSESQQESTMYFLLHKVIHFETLEDRIFDLENKNIELEVNYKILKSQLDNFTQNQSQNLDDKTDYDETRPGPEIDNINISPICNENESNSNVNPLELVGTTLGNLNENESQEKDVEKDSSMSMGQLTQVKSESEEAGMDFDVDFNSNAAGFIDMFDQLLMENVKNKSTTNKSNVEIDITDIEDKKPTFDILPYEIEKLNLNLNPVVSLKRIDPSLYLSTQNESKKMTTSLKQSKSSKKSTKCQVGIKKEKHKKVTITSEKSESSESYKCIICLKKISSQEKLTAHYKSHKIRVDIKSKIFECKICPKLFQIRPDFVRHMREHLGMKLYECTTCLRKFASHFILIGHMRVHTGEKPYSCSVCQRKFSQMQSLRRHKMIHNGEKPYGCTICSKFFRAKDHLVIHTRYHTGEKPYECSICFKKFYKKSDLNQHNKGGHKQRRKKC